MNQNPNNAYRSISEHALQAFLGGPYSRVSVREIAARAGYSHTYVHNLFGDKRTLLSASAELAAEKMSLDAAIRPEDGPRTVVLKLLSTNPLNQPIIRLIRKSSGDPEMREVLREVWKSPLCGPGFDKVSYGGFGLSPEATLVLAFSVIWSPVALDVLEGCLPDEKKDKLVGTPQELLLFFADLFLSQSEESK